MKEPQDRKRSMQDILAAAKPIEKSVTICVAGDLNGQFDDLERELADEVKRNRATLGAGREMDLASQIEALRERMAGEEVTFTFRALSARKWSDLLAANPPRRDKDESFNPDTFGAALVAACAVDPVMTVEDADALFDVLSESQFGALFGCAWRCNTKELDIPFSLLASKVLRDSGQS